MVSVAEVSAAYTCELWDRASDVNGVPAEAVLARDDVPAEGAVAVVKRDGHVVWFQPTRPDLPGYVPMTDEEAMDWARRRVVQLACAEIAVEVSASPAEAAVGEAVLLTARLPVDSPDAAVTFDAEGTTLAAGVVGGVATMEHRFERQGTHAVWASSASHAPGSVTVRIVGRS